MKNLLTKNLDFIPFNDAAKVILDHTKQDRKLALAEIEYILNLKNKQLVSIFFDEYKYFSQQDFLLIENFTNKNLSHTQKDFVSDLIYFAADFGLDLRYKKVLSLLIVKKEDVHCLVLSCLEYLSRNIKLIYVEELLENLEFIINSSHYHQNEQLHASLILYKITHKLEYLNFTKELLNYDESNIDYLRNMICNNLYRKIFFYDVFFNKFIISEFNELKI